MNINKQKKDAFLIHKPELEVDPETNPHYDPRMGIDKSKLLRPKRMTFQFVEEGKWSKDAEIIKLKVCISCYDYVALHCCFLFLVHLFMYLFCHVESIWRSPSQGAEG